MADAARQGPLIIVAAFALTACVPSLNERYYAPEVAGICIRSGAPVSGAAVLLSSRFSETTAEVRTDALGRFKVGPISETHFTRSVLGDPLYAYDLRITIGERTYRGLEEHGVGDAPKALRVTCDPGKETGRGGALSICSHDAVAPVLDP